MLWLVCDFVPSCILIFTLSIGTGNAGRRYVRIIQPARGAAIFMTTSTAELGGSSGGATDVQTELTALKADVRGLADSVQRLVAEAPSLARDSLEDSIRREPVRATLIAAGVGFILSLIVAR
jgi:hypothetical protein